MKFIQSIKYMLNKLVLRKSFIYFCLNEHWDWRWVYCTILPLNCRFRFHLSDWLTLTVPIRDVPTLSIFSYCPDLVMSRSGQLVNCKLLSFTGTIVPTLSIIETCPDP